MSYTITPTTYYSATSKLISPSTNNAHWDEKTPCMQCKAEDKIVQELPVEINAGEFFACYLCKDCLLQLASEFPT